jgi:predicted flap endonuclease-1-like 5' DNA nuclease
MGAGSAAGAPPSVSDPFRSIKGIGAVSAERLGAMGITTPRQVAAWTDDDVERVAAEIKVSAERIRREDWVGQARALVEE